jgi:hypothetical protein
VMAPTGPMRTTVDLETLSRSAASLRISRRPRGHALPSARSQRSRFRMPALDGCWRLVDPEGWPLLSAPVAGVIRRRRVPGTRRHAPPLKA